MAQLKKTHGIKNVHARNVERAAITANAAGHEIVIRDKTGEILEVGLTGTRGGREWHAVSKKMTVEQLVLLLAKPRGRSVNATVKRAGKSTNPTSNDATRSAPDAAEISQQQWVNATVLALGEALGRLVERGADLTALGQPQEIAERIAKSMPLVKSRLAEVVGPCYTSGSLQAAIGISREGVRKAAEQRRLLRLPTAEEGTFVYPAFQVREGKLITGLRDVLDALAEGSPRPWTWATWLNTPTGDNQHRYIDQLAAGDVEGVVRDARRTAAAWAA